jgi:hypothetical protein
MYHTAQIQLIVEQSSLGLVQHRQRQQAEVVVETLTHRLADMLRVQRRTLQVPSLSRPLSSPYLAPI